MYTKLLTGLLGSGLLFSTVAASQSDDVRRAIAWERHKDEAAARQARLEARHPSVTYDDNRSANRSAEEATEGRKVVDPGPPPSKRRK